MLVRAWIPTACFLAVAVLDVFCGVAQAQGGYSKQDFPRLGLEKLPVPKRWDAIPVQPTERFVVLSWAEKLPGEKERRPRRRVRPTLDLVQLQIAGDSADRGETGGGDRTSSTSRKPNGAPPASVEDYLGTLPVFAGWERKGKVRILEAKAGRRRAEREFRYERTVGPPGLRSGYAWTFEWRTEESVLFLFGRCAPDDAEEMVRIWRHMATKVRLVDPVQPDLSKWERYYLKNHRFKDPEFRLAVRARLAEVKGWKAEDTENYLIVYSTKDKALIRVLKRELEAIRRAYEDIFPPDQPLTQVSVLRVCKDAAEYYAYGGPRGSGGYWSPVAEELVFYDYQDEGGKRGSGKANSRIVLYHEAFHQYVHYAAGDLAPHSWFNEGTGDFFSGARFDQTGAVSAIGPNPWRVATIKRAAEAHRLASLERLFSASQPQYYSNGALNYAQGWALVYFLRTSRQVARRPAWAKIHPTYYSVLKSEWADRRRELEQRGVAKGTEAYLAAQAEARERALAAALANVDLGELQLALEAFILDL